MALVKCSECGKEVSDKAAACPGCNAPFGKEGGVKRLTTTQRTAKSIKLQGLLSGIMMIVGVFLISEDLYDLGTPTFLIGFIWFIVNRIRKWWHHD